MAMFPICAAVMAGPPPRQKGSGKSCQKLSGAAQHRHKTLYRIAFRIMLMDGLFQRSNGKSALLRQAFDIGSAVGIAAALRQRSAGGDGKIRILIGEESEDEQAVGAQTLSGRLKDGAQIAEMDQDRRAQD